MDSDPKIDGYNRYRGRGGKDGVDDCHSRRRGGKNEPGARRKTSGALVKFGCRNEPPRANLVSSMSKKKKKGGGKTHAPRIRNPMHRIRAAWDID